MPGALPGPNTPQMPQPQPGGTPPIDYAAVIADDDTPPYQVSGSEDESVQQFLAGLSDEDASEPEIEELQDGSVVIRMKGPATVGPLESPDFYANLAETMPMGLLKSLAIEQLDLIEKDHEARKKRDEQQEDGIRRSGLGNDAPGGANFQGANKVVHPVLAEAAVDFAASCIKELCPPDGPVKAKILGRADDEKQKKADDKTGFMNWQFTEQIEEYFDETEQMLTQLPFGGSQYIKCWYDPEQRRPRIEFVPIDNIILPFSAGSFYTSPRVTEIDDITQDTFERRIEEKVYSDVDSYSSVMMPDESQSQRASNKVEGKQDNTDNPDGIRRTYIEYVWLRLDDDPETKGARAPYILAIDENTRDVLSLRRNWEDGDEQRRKIDWLVEFKFIPWRGAYAIGFPQLIGGLSAAATGALRALLDSAHINNAATMLKMKGGRVSGQSQNIEVTQVVEIEGGVGIDDIRKLAMPMPFNPPSPVLLELLGWLTDAAKGVVTTSEEKIADANANMPVGTVQAMIEQGAKVFSAIHARLHRSQRRVMSCMARLNRWYMDEMELDEILDDYPVTPEDFSKTSDIVPVSDPNIFSDTQRYAQGQAIDALSRAQPELYNMRAVQKRILTTMKVPNIQEILPDPSNVQDMNPALENMAMVLGKPVGAFPAQDHLAHIVTHIQFGTDPMLGASPLMASTFGPAMIAHVKEHVCFWYMDRMSRYADESALEEGPVDAAVQKIMAVASEHVRMDAQKTLAQFLQALTPAIQAAAQAAQAAGQSDPSIQAQLQIAQAETARRTAKDQADAQIAQSKLQLESQLGQAHVKIDAAKLQQQAKNQDTDNARQEQHVEIGRQDHIDNIRKDLAIANASNITQERIHGVDAQLDAARIDAEMQRTMLDEINIGKQARADNSGEKS